MKNKNKILKNNLNILTFKKNLYNQQEHLIQFYNKLIISDNTYLETDSNYYMNELPFSEIDNKDELPLWSNIFKIRFKQTKDILIKLSEKKWPNINICKNILELKGNVKLKFNNIKNNIFSF